MKRIVQTAEEGSVKDKEQKESIEKVELTQAINAVVPEVAYEKNPSESVKIENPVVPVPIPAQAHQQSETQPEQQRNTITPKELERMMRVTLHDKPPA